MAFSSIIPNFIHFPISISNSNYLNRAAPPLSTKRRLRGSLCVKCHGDNAEPENKEPFETDDKLYKGIENKDIAPLSDAMADQPQPPHFFNSIPFLQHLGAKPKKTNFLSNIMKALQNSLIFVVQPTTKDGSMVGIKWKVGWNKALIESEKGISIHSHHSYVGKLLIGNLETIIDPLLRLGPKALKNWKLVATKERRVVSLCVGFFLLVLSLFFFQFSVR